MPTFDDYSNAKFKLAELNVRLVNLRREKETAVREVQSAQSAFLEQTRVYRDFGDQVEKSGLQSALSKRDEGLSAISSKYGASGSDLWTQETEQKELRIATGWYDQQTNFLEQEIAKCEGLVESFEQALDQAEEEQVERLHGHELELADRRIREKELELEILRQQAKNDDQAVSKLDNLIKDIVSKRAK